MEPVSRENAEHYFWGGKCDGWHLVKTPGISIIEERVPPGGAETRHVHARSEQFFYVLAGTATVEADGRVHELHSNEGLHIPAGKPHRLSNRCGENLSFIVVSVPPSHGDRVGA